MFWYILSSYLCFHGKAKKHGETPDPISFIRDKHIRKDTEWVFESAKIKFVEMQHNLETLITVEGNDTLELRQRAYVQAIGPETKNRVRDEGLGVTPTLGPNFSHNIISNVSWPTIYTVVIRVCECTKGLSKLYHRIGGGKSKHRTKNGGATTKNTTTARCFIEKDEYYAFSILSTIITRSTLKVITFLPTKYSMNSNVLSIFHLSNSGISSNILSTNYGLSSRCHKRIYCFAYGRR